MYLYNKREGSKIAKDQGLEKEKMKQAKNTKTVLLKYVIIEILIFVLKTICRSVVLSQLHKWTKFSFD